MRRKTTEALIRQVIREELTALLAIPGKSWAPGQRDIRWLVGRAARAAVKDYADEIREAVKIEERVIRGEPVTDAERNFLNLHRLDQKEAAE